MDNILENSIGQPNLSDKEIFTRIWTSPREIFRYLEQREYQKYFFILLVLTGIIKSFTLGAAKQEGIFGTE